MICFPTVFCNFILLSPLQFLTDLLSSSECNFKDRLDSLIFSSYSMFRCKKFILWDLNIHCSFSLVLSMYGKFILILISPSWISVACISCCDWGKLCILVILWKILLIMLLWCPFSFNTCCILVFSLCKSYLFVIMEYALLNKEETALSLQLVWWWEL